MDMETYNKLKGTSIPCPVNDLSGQLIDGQGIVCGYKENYLILGFDNDYEGCVESFAKSVVIDIPFKSYRFWNMKYLT